MVGRIPVFNFALSASFFFINLFSYIYQDCFFFVYTFHYMLLEVGPPGAKGDPGDTGKLHVLFKLYIVSSSRFSIKI